MKSTTILVRTIGPTFECLHRAHVEEIKHPLVQMVDQVGNVQMSDPFHPDVSDKKLLSG